MSTRLNTPSPLEGEGWGEGCSARSIVADKETPHPALSRKGRGY
jgi:hypothetical protein